MGGWAACILTGCRSNVLATRLLEGSQAARRRQLTQDGLGTTTRNERPRNGDESDSEKRVLKRITVGHLCQAGSGARSKVALLG